VPSTRNTTRSYAAKSKSSCNFSHPKRLAIGSCFDSQRRLTWEIRFGPDNCFRVPYGIDDDKREVEIQAIGVKDGNRLLVAGKEVAL
jgi:hypothetical protein